jgi:hypothetical protein
VVPASLPLVTGAFLWRFRATRAKRETAKPRRPRQRRIDLVSPPGVMRNKAENHCAKFVLGVNGLKAKHAGTPAKAVSSR